MNQNESNETRRALTVFATLVLFSLIFVVIIVAPEIAAFEQALPILLALLRLAQQALVERRD
jgi:hypothetical protein